MTPLTAADLAMFARFGVGPELLATARISRLTDPETRETLALNGASGDMSGILFPYLSPKSGYRVGGRVRRDNPEIENGKARNKYMSGYGDRRHLYMVPSSEALLADATMPVILIESEKAALSIYAWSQRTNRHIVPIATGGCYGWRGKIGRTENANGERVDEVGPLPDLVEWCTKRRCYILFDSNCATNAKVRIARRDLARALVKLDAEVRILNLPSGEGINGPDDYLHRMGGHRFKAGQPWWLETDALNESATLEQNERYDPGVWDDVILEWLENPTQRFDAGQNVTIPIEPFDSDETRVTVTDVLVHAIGKPLDRLTQGDRLQVVRCLNHAGWKRKQVGSGLKRGKWFYVRQNVTSVTSL